MNHEHIVNSIRDKLAPFVDEKEYEARYGVHYSNQEEASSRFVRKIPRNNYDDLAKLIPISWL